ncbi:MAG: hypothetical protein ACRCT8_00680 [Lacipirellulaceae bacterium]
MNAIRVQLLQQRESLAAERLALQQELDARSARLAEIAWEEKTLDAILAMLERRMIVPSPNPSGLKRGDAQQPTIERERFRGFVIELLADNGGRMPVEDLRQLASERVTADGCCLKMVGKWFGEIIRNELAETPEGCVALPTPRDLAFADALSLTEPRDVA